MALQFDANAMLIVALAGIIVGLLLAITIIGGRKEPTSICPPSEPAFSSLDGLATCLGYTLLLALAFGMLIYFLAHLFTG